MEHDWESEIIGYLPQSEPRWVTTNGYRPPILKYTCKVCGQTYSSRAGSMLFIEGYGLLSECSGEAVVR